MLWQGTNVIWIELSTKMDISESGPQTSLLDECKWLILCVNLTWLRDPQMDGKTLFLGVSVRVCPVEISIWIGEMSKVDSPLQCMWASSNTLRVRIEQKGRRRTNSVWAGTCIFSCPQTAVISSSLVFGFRLGPSAPWFSILWTWPELFH